MKNPTFESASAAIAPRKKSLEERQESRRQGGSTDHLRHALPEDRSLAELLGFDDVPAVEDILRIALLHPVADLASNPGKRIRAQLVSFSYRLLSGEMPPSVAAANRSS